MNGSLVDTHILIWSLEGDERLRDHHRTIIASESVLWVSVATLWEIAIKQSLGKLKAPEDLPEKLHSTGYRILDITIQHIEMLRILPHHHRDPFDRMLIAQARAEGLTLLTADRNFAAYGIEVA